MTTIRFLLCWLLLLGAAPSRTKTYVSGQVISPSDVTENEDGIFSYLQAGVDTYRTSSITAAAITDGTIVNADISSSAVIALSKLATGSSGQLIVADGSGIPTYVTLGTDATLASTGALTIAANAVALSTDTTGNFVATVADAGNTTVTVSGSGSENAAITLDAVDVNCSNCIDGTDIAIGSDAQGDILYYGGTDWNRLGAGTSGQFLKTQGAGANPTWADNTAAWLFVETLTFSGSTSVSSSTLPTTSDQFLLVFDDMVDNGPATAGGLVLTFNGDGGANYNYTTLARATLAYTSGATGIQLTAGTNSQICGLAGTLMFNRLYAVNPVGVVMNLIGNRALTDNRAIAVSGEYTAAGNITSFTLSRNPAQGSWTGQVHLYRLSKQ